MTGEEKNILKEKLGSDIAALQKQIAALQEKIEPLGDTCCVDEITRAETFAEQEVTGQILHSSMLRMKGLQTALLRIDTPMFGICSECEEEIGFGRMSIRPESTRCVECSK